MSNLYKAISTTKTGRERAVVQPLDMVVVNVDDDITYRYDGQAEYRVEVKIGTYIYMDNFHPEYFPLAIEDAKKQIVHHVFGEFKDYFYKIRRHIYQGDNYKALELLEEMKNNMFSTDNGE